MSDAAIASVQGNESCLRLQIADVRFLFVGPEIDPLAGNNLGLSGVELIIQQLGRLPRAARKQLRLELVFPANGIPLEMTERITSSALNNAVLWRRH